MAAQPQGIAGARRALGVVFVVLPMVFGVSACSDRALDTGLVGAVTGEPSPVSDNPSPVRGLSGAREEYPNLGSVPNRPADLATPAKRQDAEAARQKTMDRLAADRAASRRTKTATEAIPMPEPLPVPPKPNLQPGRS